MWELAISLVVLVVLLIGSGIWQVFREEGRKPKLPKEAFLTLLSKQLGLDPAHLKGSTFLLSGPMADELDITDLFREVEKKFGIDLPDSEMEGTETVDQLWALVERKISSQAASPPDR